MKRIALLKNNFYPKGGLEKHAHQLATVFAERGCETLVLTQHPRGMIPRSFVDDAPYTVIPLGHNSFYHLKSRREFDRRCRDWADAYSVDLLFGFDRISCQTHYLAGDGVHKVYLRQRKGIEGKLKTLSHRFNPKHNRSLQEEREMFEGKRVHIFPNSHMVREDILETYNADPNKLSVVHNGIEWEALATPFREWPEKREALFRKLALDKGRYQLLFVGHGYKRKGLIPLLNGLARLPKDSFQLSIVGREAHPKPYLKAIRDLGLEGSVKVFGAQTDTRPFFQVADACVIPSLYDPFANVTVEALAMGLYVITSDFNGGKEALTPESGTIIDSLFNPDSVAEALKKALLFPKTEENAKQIRQTVSHLEVSSQLGKVVDLALDS